MPQFGAHLTIVIYDPKTFIVQATGVTDLSLYKHWNKYITKHYPSKVSGKQSLIIVRHHPNKT